MKHGLRQKQGYKKWLKRYPLNRRNLRDIIIISSLGSALYFDINSTRLLIAFCMLGAGCFTHYISKGILIRNVILCTDGIYRVVRHPYYLANFLIDWSFCLMSGGLLLLVFYPFLFFLAYGPTIRQEEKTLYADHGDLFISNNLKIPQIFPDAGSIKNITMLFNGFSFKRITLKEYSRIMKFSATGLLLALVHSLKTDIIPGLRQVSFPAFHNFGQYLLALLVILLYFASIITLRLSQPNRHIHCEIFAVKEIRR